MLKVYTESILSEDDFRLVEIGFEAIPPDERINEERVGIPFDVRLTVPVSTYRELLVCLSQEFQTHSAKDFEQHRSVPNICTTQELVDTFTEHVQDKLGQEFESQFSPCDWDCFLNSEDFFNACWYVFERILDDLRQTGMDLGAFVSNVKAQCERTGKGVETTASMK